MVIFRLKVYWEQDGGRDLVKPKPYKIGLI